METVLSPTVFYIISGVLVAGVLVGLSLMSKPKTARAGNAISALSTVIAIAVTMYNYQVLTAPVIWGAIAVGVVISIVIAVKVAHNFPFASALRGSGLSAYGKAFYIYVSSLIADNYLFKRITHRCGGVL